MLTSANDAETTAQPVDLSDVTTLRALLLRHGLHPNKAFGQHLLVDRGVLSTLVEAAEVSSLDSVLEVGAGPGVLTIELAKRARRVVAVELDQNILPVLRETTAHLPQVEILPTNLLAVDPAQVFGKEPYKLVAPCGTFWRTTALQGYWC
jgi:16S rRNA (adenine1518-N6/adenine1519-N6)-dimethyltransferase